MPEDGAKMMQGSRIGETAIIKLFHAVIDKVTYLKISLLWDGTKKTKNAAIFQRERYHNH